MKYKTALVAFSLFVILSPGNLFATCNPTITGPHGPACPAQWFSYTFDTSCADISGSAQGNNNWCEIGHSFDYVSPGGDGYATYTFTPSGSGSGSWDLKMYVDFNDPNNSVWDFVWIQVAVTHNGSTSYNTFFSINGTQGDLNCYQATTGFGAVNGDTVSISIGAQALYSGTQIRVSRPYVSRSNC